MKRKMKPVVGYVIVDANGSARDEVHYRRAFARARLWDWQQRRIAPEGARIARVIIRESPNPRKRGKA